MLPVSLRAGEPILHLTPSLGAILLSSTYSPQRLLGLNYYHHSLSNYSSVTEHSGVRKQIPLYDINTF